MSSRWHTFNQWQAKPYERGDREYLRIMYDVEDAFKAHYRRGDKPPFILQFGAVDTKTLSEWELHTVMFIANHRFQFECRYSDSYEVEITSCFTTPENCQLPSPAQIDAVIDQNRQNGDKLPFILDFGHLLDDRTMDERSELASVLRRYHDLKIRLDDGVYRVVEAYQWGKRR